MTDPTITLTTHELSSPLRIPEPEAEPLKHPTRIPILSDGGSWKYVRYVRHHEVEAYIARGWVVSDDLSGTHHGAHAALMSWPHEGEPE